MFGRAEQININDQNVGFAMLEIFLSASRSLII